MRTATRCLVAVSIVTVVFGVEHAAAWWMIESGAAGALLSPGGGDPATALATLAFVAIRIGVRWLGPGIALWLGLWALWPTAKRSRARCASTASAAG